MFKKRRGSVFWLAIGLCCGGVAQAQTAEPPPGTLPLGALPDRRPEVRPESPLPTEADANVAPRPGEIRLEGTVKSVAGDSLVLQARAFALPNGRRLTFAAPKPKTVPLSGAAIVAQGDPWWRLKTGDIAAGYRAIVVGRDTGSGQPLKARVVALTRIDEGARRDYFVTQKGDDAGDGTAESPWRSIPHALESVPDGTSQAPRVLHVGAGDFSSDSDGRGGRLRVIGKNFLVITGAGARGGGTRLTTGNFAKQGTGVVWISGTQGLRICNLVIGDDRAWDDKNAFFEATVFLDGGSKVSLEAVQILGPSRRTTLEAASRRAPTALQVADPNSEAQLFNVLVSGHGSFLSNPEGKVKCRNVSFARLFGVGYDDHFLFLQTPHGEPRNERRYSFRDCLFYELEGPEEYYGGQAFLTSGEDGEDKAFWEPASDAGSGNFAIYLRFKAPDKPYEAPQFAAAFRGKRGGHYTLCHGIWENDDTRAKATGALSVCNDLQLSARDGFPLAAPALKSGWLAGFAAPSEAPDTF